MGLNTNGRLARAKQNLAWALTYCKSTFQAEIDDNYFNGYKIKFTKGRRSVVKMVRVEVLDDCDSDDKSITAGLDNLLSEIDREFDRPSN